MSDRPEPIALPQKIRAFLVAIVKRKWTAVESDPRPVIEALPRSLPAGQVERVVSGGPFGWLIDARLDEIGGRVALEVLEDDRMSGPNHYRVWEDGTEESLESEMTAWTLPENASREEAKRIEDEFYAHNRAVQGMLRERGFLPGPESAG
jgi:hypothetical protein